MRTRISWLRLIRSRKERKVIMLKVFEEWTIREIADCLHENPNTVKSMLYRGLKKLRGKVEAEMV